MVFDRLEKLDKYVTQEQFQKIVKFLRKISKDMEERRYEIDGESIYARVMSYQTSLQHECRIEAHDKYIDIQVSISGMEGIDIFDRDTLDIVQDYDKDKDVAFYEGMAMPCVSVRNVEGYFTMIFPREAHRPKVSIDQQYHRVKKFVIKVRCEEQVL